MLDVFAAVDFIEGHSLNQRSQFVGEVCEVRGDGWALVEAKNQFAVGNTLEIIHPSGNRRLSVERLENTSGARIAVAAGNGQSELAEVITGLRRCTAGRVRVQGDDVANRSPLDAIKHRVAHVPEDRTHVGSAPNLSITDNVIMKSYRKAPLANGWSLNYAKARQRAQELKDAYAILAPTVDTEARLLSGGNLQRAILSRELSQEPQLLVAMQPTRGLDVGAIEGVQRLLLAQREAGAAILLSSEELEELLALSDRILVMYEGEIAGEVADGDAERIGLLMTGGGRDTTSDTK